jgi:hypothetical protein
MLKLLSLCAILAVSVNAASIDIMVGSGTVTPTPSKVTELPDGSQLFEFDEISDNETFEISSLFVSFKEDPFVDYGFAVKNFAGAPLSFLFVFTTPYVGGPYSLLDSSHSSSVTDSSPTDGTVTVTTDKKASIHTPAIDGVDIVGGALGVGCAPAGAKGFSAVCEAPAGVVGFPVATLAAGTLSITVSFTLSPGDIYTANGRTEIYNGAVIPEPSTYAMAIGGLGLLLVARRFRR